MQSQASVAVPLAAVAALGAPAATLLSFVVSEQAAATASTWVELRQVDGHNACGLSRAQERQSVRLLTKQGYLRSRRLPHGRGVMADLAALPPAWQAGMVIDGNGRSGEPCHQSDRQKVSITPGNLEAVVRLVIGGNCRSLPGVIDQKCRSLQPDSGSDRQKVSITPTDTPPVIDTFRRSPGGIGTSDRQKVSITRAVVKRVIDRNRRSLRHRSGSDRQKVSITPRLIDRNRRSRPTAAPRGTSFGSEPSPIPGTSVATLKYNIRQNALDRHPIPVVPSHTLRDQIDPIDRSIDRSGDSIGSDRSDRSIGSIDRSELLDRSSPIDRVDRSDPGRSFSSPLSDPIRSIGFVNPIDRIGSVNPIDRSVDRSIDRLIDPARAGSDASGSDHSDASNAEIEEAEADVHRALQAMAGEHGVSIEAARRYVAAQTVLERARAKRRPPSDVVTDPATAAAIDLFMAINSGQVVLGPAALQAVAAARARREAVEAAERFANTNASQSRQEGQERPLDCPDDQSVSATAPKPLATSYASLGAIAGVDRPEHEQIAAQRAAWVAAEQERTDRAESLERARQWHAAGGVLPSWAKDVLADGVPNLVAPPAPKPAAAPRIVDLRTGSNTNASQSRQEGQERPLAIAGGQIDADAVPEALAVSYAPLEGIAGAVRRSPEPTPLAPAMTHSPDIADSATSELCAPVRKGPLPRTDLDCIDVYAAYAAERGLTHRQLGATLTGKLRLLARTHGVPFVLEAIEVAKELHYGDRAFTLPLLESICAEVAETGLAPSDWHQVRKDYLTPVWRAMSEREKTALFDRLRSGSPAPAPPLTQQRARAAAQNEQARADARRDAESRRVHEFRPLRPARSKL